ncbi:hypothetical protein HDE_00986 [Halotydeus destructor]|nr:hypothetical protein HDE_00986 [Halotydeus destructor]
MSLAVRNRFKAFNRIAINCKIAIYDVEILKTLDGDLQFHNLLHGVHRYAVHNLNYTEIVSTDITSGDVGDHGNYSGAVGLMQSGEVDYTWSWLRSDCIKSESLGVLAPVFGADVRIVSPILDEDANTESIVKVDSRSDRFEPFLDTLALVDRYSYLALCATALAVAILVAIRTQGRAKNRFVSDRFIHRFSQCLFSIFELVVGQGKIINGKTIVLLVWLLLNLGLFIIIAGLFLNLLHTEKVAQRNPDQVETIRDIVGTKFKGVEPTLITNSYTFPLRKLVKNGSDEAKLFQALKKNPRNLYTFVAKSTDLAKNDELALLFKEVERKTRYLLYEEVFWKPMKPLLCFISPDHAKLIYASRNTILNGLLVAPYRKGINEGLKSYLEYRLKNQFELGLTGHDINRISEAVAKVTSYRATGRNGSTMCLLGLKEEAQISKMQFRLRHSKSILWFLFTLIMMSVAGIVSEMFFMKKAKSKVARKWANSRQVLQVARLKAYCPLRKSLKLTKLSLKYATAEARRTEAREVKQLVYSYQAPGRVRVAKQIQCFT